jgi:uncharacterized protein
MVIVMKRDIYQQLREWKGSTRRKPLILRGARQVGKTYILKTFAQNEYDDYIYLNFDEEPQLIHLFEKDLKPERILKELSIYFKKSIFPHRTLLIFDEIQECAGALNSLKYFCEQSNDYHLVAAGSLLGVKLNAGFPVGKVNFLDLAPLSFFEFLEAMGDQSLRELMSKLICVEPIATIFHEKLLARLKEYFVIGGMPEAVTTYIETQDLYAVRVTQRDILDAYTLDFAKHASKEVVMKIMAIWDLIPRQLAKENKKFIFSAISKSARAREYEDSIQWLVKAGLIMNVYHISTPQLPLAAYADRKAFKIYMLDVGLLGAISHLDPNLILQGDALFKEFKGALTENYVSQELRLQCVDNLYYWTSEGIAEVDFLIAKNQCIFPLEVKAGLSKKKKSLRVYGDKYLANDQHSVLSRTTLRNFMAADKIINYPLYAVSLFPCFHAARVNTTDQII